MSPDLRNLVMTSDEVGLERAYLEDECPEFFVVDWREDDAHIVLDCAKALSLESLSAESRDENVFILLDGREFKVPLQFNAGDRHVTVCALNDVLNPNYEVRFLVCSHGTDSGGFAALNIADWREFEKTNAPFIAENFIDPRKLPNIFTELTDEELPPAARARFDRMLRRNKTRPNVTSIRSLLNSIGRWLS